LTAGGDNRRIAKLDVLCTKGNRTQTGTTHLIDAPSGAFNRQSCIDVRLARWVLTLGSC